ncbi:MAG TPA: hypothetical protein VGJ05_07450 [Fimbriiglobus sp.]|jgi:hypothetical protein
MNKDMLKKHHFWVLAGLVPLFILLAVLLTWTGVSGEIAAKTTTINNEVTTIKGKSPKGKGYEEEMEKQKEQLEKKVGELWAANWRAQRDLIVWPNDGRRLENFLYDPALKTKDGLPEYRKFGSPLDNSTDVFEVFKNQQIYTAPFEQAAKLAEPTQLLNGWQSIFRYIQNWGTKTPVSDVLWLTLEDLWVQRGLMLPVKAVNDAAAAFYPVSTKPGPDGKVPENTFTFRSRIWEVEFQIASRGSEKALLARLTNITDRLQLLGARNSMTLDVWFDTSPSQEKGAHFPYKIEAEYVKAGETIPVTYLPTFHQPDGNPTKVTKVVQEFDRRTVPIRRIDRLEIGYLDNRHQFAELKPPTFIKVPEATAADASAGPAAGDPLAAAAMAGGRRGRGTPGSPDGAPGGTGPGGFGAATGAGWEGFLDSTKNRYIDVTEQVRRIPIAMVFIVDQDYERDLMIALANSKLRFQITQFHSQRFRGTISTGAEGDATSPDGSGFAGGGTASVPSGFLGSGFGGAEGSVSGGRLAGPGRFAGPGRGGPIIPGGGFGFPGAGPGGFSGGYGQTGSTGVAESSATAGLIEISIYGIVTLYERYEPKADPSAVASDPVSPAPANPTTPTNNPTNPAAPTNPSGSAAPAEKPKK